MKRFYVVGLSVLLSLIILNMAQNMSITKDKVLQMARRIYRTEQIGRYDITGFVQFDYNGKQLVYSWYKDGTDELKEVVYGK